MIVTSKQVNTFLIWNIYFEILEEFDKIRGLSGKEFYEELEKACYKPELKLNSKDIAKIEIDAKIAKYNLILEVFIFIL